MTTNPNVFHMRRFYARLLLLGGGFGGNAPSPEYRFDRAEDALDRCLGQLVTIHPVLQIPATVCGSFVGQGASFFHTEIRGHFGFPFPLSTVHGNIITAQRVLTHNVTDFMKDGSASIHGKRVHGKLQPA